MSVLHVFMNDLPLKLESFCKTLGADRYVSQGSGCQWLRGCISAAAPSSALPPAVASAVGGRRLVHVGVLLLQVAAALGVGGEEVPGLRGTVWFIINIINSIIKVHLFKTTSAL